MQFINTETLHTEDDFQRPHLSRALEAWLPDSGVVLRENWPPRRGRLPVLLLVASDVKWL